MIIWVKRTYAGTWGSTERDTHGRALASNLETQSGLVVRVVGIYGVTGTCLPGFEEYPALKDSSMLITTYAIDASFANEPLLPINKECIKPSTKAAITIGIASYNARTINDKEKNGQERTK